MLQYKGQYVDGVIFKTPSDIDEFQRQCALDSYKKACQLFMEKPTMATSMYVEERAITLHNQYGLGWDDIQDIENMVWGV